MEWWVKKHAPQSLINLIDHEHVIRQFKKFIQLKTLDLLDKEEVITLKQNQHYWPARDIRWDGNEWRGTTLSR